jgi:hypothetical protein
MLHHSAFLFDYLAFRRHISPIISSLDQGDIQPLFAEAKSVFDDIEPDKWILHDEGTELERFEANEILDQSDIGYLLLVVLSRFLQPAPNLASWGTLSIILETNFSWSKEETEFLIHGTVLSSLLKPNEAPPKVLTVKDPYWFWMFPTQSYRNGWLPFEEVVRLLNKINTIRDQAVSSGSQVDNLTMGDTLNLSADDLKKIRASLNEVLLMLRSAKDAKRGLFYVIDY